MPVPNYFAPKQKSQSLAEITGGMTSAEIRAEIERGARFVYYQYVASALVVSRRRNSKILFLGPGENRAIKSLPYTLTTLLIGWWGVPHGLMYTPVVIYRNLRGGTDITPSVLAKLQPAAAPAQV